MQNNRFSPTFVMNLYSFKVISRCVNLEELSWKGFVNTKNCFLFLQQLPPVSRRRIQSCSVAYSAVVTKCQRQRCLHCSEIRLWLAFAFIISLGGAGVCSRARTLEAVDTLLREATTSSRLLSDQHLSVEVISFLFHDERCVKPLNKFVFVCSFSTQW